MRRYDSGAGMSGPNTQERFDVAKAPALWDRLAAEEPWRVHSDLKAFSGRYRLGHTAMALRAPVIRETVADIRRQLEAGAAVAP